MQGAKWVIQIEPNNRYYVKILTLFKQYSLQAFSVETLIFLLNNLPCHEIVIIPRTKIPKSFESFLKEAEKMKIPWQVWRKREK